MLVLWKYRSRRKDEQFVSDDLTKSPDVRGDRHGTQVSAGRFRSRAFT